MAESQVKFRSEWYRRVRRILFATAALLYVCFRQPAPKRKGVRRKNSASWINRWVN